MKSIKPGRGPSFMGGVGSVVAAVFGVFWTIGAASMGAPWFFPLFGVIFVLLGIGQAIYNFTNATGQNRFSEFDITDEGEESDPLNQYFGSERPEKSDSGETSGGYCPYCGAPAGTEHAFCKRCGKKLD